MQWVGKFWGVYFCTKKNDKTPYSLLSLVDTCHFWLWSFLRLLLSSISTRYFFVLSYNGSQIQKKKVCFPFFTDKNREMMSDTTKLNGGRDIYEYLYTQKLKLKNISAEVVRRERRRRELTETKKGTILWSDLEQKKIKF